MKLRNRLLTAGLCCVTIAGILLSTFRVGSNSRETLIITMPESRMIRNIDMNYYTHWLEEQTNTNLVFNLIPETYGADYLEQVFTSNSLKADIVFAAQNEDDNFFTYERVEALGESGYILPLNCFITEQTQFQKIANQFSDYDLKAYMTAADGNLYFFPNLDASERARWGQSFWINRSWLQELGLPQPQNTQELYQVLTSFVTNDPNKNGQNDEVAIAGEGLFDHIINSFIYNDPTNMRMLVQDKQVYFAPITDQWRQAMQYLNDLYRAGVLTDFQQQLSQQQLTELASSPQNLLGIFTSPRIEDVIHPTCTDVVNDFYALVPIKGPEGVAFSSAKTPVPKVGALISADSTNPQKAFELLDLMLSEEAFLIAQYGQQGVDWNWASASDLDSHGNKAVIKVEQPLENRAQSKNFAQMGPLYVYPQYANHVAWSGFDPEHMNARVYDSNLLYAPEEALGLIGFRGAERDELNGLRTAVEQYTEEAMNAFILGEKSVGDDAVWAEYVKGFEQLELERLIAATQMEYEALQSWRKEK